MLFWTRDCNWLVVKLPEDWSQYWARSAKDTQLLGVVQVIGIVISVSLNAQRHANVHPMCTVTRYH